MKLSSFINEKLLINNEYEYKKNVSCAPKNEKELQEIVIKRLEAQNGGSLKKPVDLNDIELTNIKNLSNFFYKINYMVDNKLFAIDISEWDILHITKITGLFSNCKNLLYVGDLYNWRTENISDMSNMFENCKKLKELPGVEDWDVSSVVNFTKMFMNCEKLNYINIDKWRVNSNLTRENCKMIISGTSGWKRPEWFKALNK